ncbi:hypothetical protein [Uliginosibacterium flavum]|uniref:Solute-binding protein family 3/N-terminal domain-containing protein n=1 Tax=Uliginosibacterium flavum TaxID=1396831 RepID=A0ABV2TJK1_9RHOO
MRLFGENAGRQLLLGLLTLLGLISVPSVKAEDVLRRQRQDVGVERRNDYTNQVLTEAMRRTQKKFGPYRIEVSAGRGGRERLLLDMIDGEKFNTTVMASQPRWEQQLLPIWIPTDMGLSNYRIALTHRNAQARISAVQTLDQLKALRVGVGAAWSSRKVLDANGFNTVRGENFEPLLKMLTAERVDYFPRGMNEVFVEYDDRSKANPDLLIERDLVVEFPLPGYVFVSPKAPRLHQRLTEGLESMVHDGTLLKMVMNYHAEMIKRANFCSRRVFHIENPFLSDKTPLQRKELWFNPYDPKTGICPVSTQKNSRAAR